MLKQQYKDCDDDEVLVTCMSVCTCACGILSAVWNVHMHRGYTHTWAPKCAENLFRSSSSLGRGNAGRGLTMNRGRKLTNLTYTHTHTHTHTHTEPLGCGGYVTSVPALPCLAAPGGVQRLLLAGGGGGLRPPFLACEAAAGPVPCPVPAAVCVSTLHTHTHTHTHMQDPCRPSSLIWHPPPPPHTHALHTSTHACIHTFIRAA